MRGPVMFRAWDATYSYTTWELGTVPLWLCTKIWVNYQCKQGEHVSKLSTKDPIERKDGLGGLPTTALT
eukprot:SAG31_NODE_1034_length_10228_cov_89.107316_6_plen_69_part_00